MRKWAKALGDLQDSLGELNDVAVISTRLGHTHTFTAEEALCATSQVVGQFTRPRRTERDAWRPVWRTAADKKQLAVAVIVSLASVKGGVGKTSTAVNLAALAAADGRRVLLWDLDPQGAATYTLGVGAARPVGHCA